MAENAGIILFDDASVRLNSPHCNVDPLTTQRLNEADQDQLVGLGVLIALS